MSTYNKYRIPVPKDLLQLHLLPMFGHINALDFVLPQTTPILVAAYGEEAFVSERRKLEALILRTGLLLTLLPSNIHLQNTHDMIILHIRAQK